MSVFDAYWRAFEMQVWRPFADLTADLTALFYDEPKAFSQEMSRSWYGDDVSNYIAMARVLRRHGRLRRDDVRRLPSCLLVIGSYDEALGLLLDNDFPGEKDEAYWHDLARALAGAGRLGDASGAIKTALELTPEDESFQSFARVLSRTLELARAAKTTNTWPVVEELIDKRLQLGQYDEALTDFQSCMMRPWDEPVQRKVVAAAAARAAAGVTSSQAYGFVRSLQRLHPRPPRADRIRWAAERLLTRDHQSTPQGESAGAQVDLCLALALEAGGEPRAAIALLEPYLRADPDRARLDAARCIGGTVIGAHPLRIRRRFGERRKIFNLITFNDELTMMRLRFAEMAEWVDRFIIVEARTTFTGRPKPLHFAEHKREFDAFKDKIIHVVVDVPEWIDSAWGRDFYQRDMAVAGIAGEIGSEDLVLLTDADEIVARDAVLGFEGECASLKTETFRYFFNYRLIADRETQRRTASLWKAKYLQRFGSSYLRFGLPYYQKTAAIDDAGWHFTSVADASIIANKHNSYAHEEYSGGDATVYASKLAQIRSGVLDPGWERWPLDDRFPAFLRDNRDSLSALIL